MASAFQQLGRGNGRMEFLVHRVGAWVQPSTSWNLSGRCYQNFAGRWGGKRNCLLNSPGRQEIWRDAEWWLGQVMESDSQTQVLTATLIRLQSLSDLISPAKCFASPGLLSLYVKGRQGRISLVGFLWASVCNMHNCKPATNGSFHNFTKTNGYKSIAWCVHYPGGSYSATLKSEQILHCVQKSCCVAELLVRILYAAKLTYF